MKLSSDFIVHNIDGMTMLVPVENAGFHGVARGNKSVEVILRCLERGATEEEIVEAMCARFDGDRKQMEADVADVLTQLRSIGAIIE